MSVPRGTQRVALIVLALALAAASFGAFQQAGKASDALEAEATASAERAAAAIGAALVPEDLGGPVGGERYQTLSSVVDGGLVAPDDSVVVLNGDAVVVFAQDRAILGQKQSRAKVARVVSSGTQTELRAGTFSVFVPVIVGGPTEIAIVDIAGPSQAIEAARGPWIIVTIAAGVLALLVLVFAFSVNGSRSAGFGDSISPSRMLDIERRHEKEMAGLEKTLERAKADESGVRAELDKVTGELTAHKKVLTELDEAVNKAEARAAEVEGKLAGATSRISDAEARANHAEAGESEARARITAAESRARDAERQTADANARARHAEEWAEDLAALGDDLQRAGSGDDEEFKRLRTSLVEAKRQAASAREAKRELADRVEHLGSANRTLEADREALASERGAIDAERQGLVAERESLERARAAAEAEAMAAREELRLAQQQLERAVTTSKAQLATARRELEEGGAELAAARGELEDARAREAEMSVRVEESTTEAERFRAEAERARTDADRAAAEIRGARLAEQEKSAQLADATEQLASLQRQVDEATEQLREQQGRAGAAEAKVVDLYHQVQSLEQRPDLTGEVGSLQASLSDANERVAALETELASTRSEMEVAQRAGAEVADRLAEQRSRADRAEAEVSELTRETAELAEQITDLEARPDLTADLDAARGERSDLAARLETVSSELAAARADVDAARSQAEAREAALDAALTEAEARKGELEAARAEAEVAKAELVATRVNADAVKAELEDARAEIETIRADLESARAAAGETQASEQALQDKLRAVREKAEARREKIDGLASELDAANAALEDGRAELERVTSERASMSAELQRTKADLENTRALAGKTEADQRTLAAELRTTAEEAEARRREDERLRAELESRKVEEERLAAELETGRGEVERLRAELDFQRAEADGLRAESESARADVDRLRAESKELLHEKDRLIENLQASEWEAGTERARAEELARRQEMLQAHADDVARKAAEEAIAARGRLLETQETLARFQSELERVATNSVSAGDVGLDAEGVQGVVNALSTDAKRSLSAIFGLARMMSSQGPAPDEGRMLQQLMSQARRMEHALTDILDAERLARGEVVLKRRSTEIDTLIRRVVREFPLTDGRQVEVIAETATIQIDPARLERLVDDLLSSAMTRTPRGERVVLRLERTNDGVTLGVEAGAASGVEVGPAATFLAKLHGGWTSAEDLPGGRGVARVFLPSDWTPAGPGATVSPDGADEADPAIPAPPEPDGKTEPADRAEATA